ESERRRSRDIAQGNHDAIDNSEYPVDDLGVDTQDGHQQYAFRDTSESGLFHPEVQFATWNYALASLIEGLLHARGFTHRRSKRLTQRDVQRGAPLEAPGDHFRVGLEAQVHADRPNWRS